jgi:processive 1,2-diacylglycerol beta-glucosyltransferase
MSPGVKSLYILFEYGLDRRPFGSAQIRLLRPFTHPSLQGRLSVLSGIEFVGEPVDAVIIDRLWRPDISLEMAGRVIAAIRRVGAKVIYALDDNFLAIPEDHVDRPSQAKLDVVEYFLRQADAILVTTPELQRSFAPYNSNILVLPHALDERLLVPRTPGSASAFSEQETGMQSRRVVVGSMGTFTHDNDLLTVLPALKAVCDRHPGGIEFEFIGMFGRYSNRQHFADLPVRFLELEGEERSYPLFMLWYTSRAHWDIAFAPLHDNAFNRHKSDIKFLDYCAVGAAGIFSSLPCYQATIRHRDTGWLVENRTEAWVDALETLVSDHRLRNRIAWNAYNYLYSERILAHCAEKWFEAIDQILA